MMKRLSFCLLVLCQAATACIKINPGSHPTSGGNTAGGTSSGHPGGTPPGGGGGGNGPSGSFTGPQIRYIGRVDTNANGGVAMSWPGTAAQVRVVNASHVMFYLLNQQHLQWNSVAAFVDGTPAQTWQIADGQLQYVLPLPDTDAHVVTLVKRNEAGNGTLVLNGIETDGSFESAPASPGRFIEFIGDTLSTGYAVLGPAGNANCVFPPDCVADPNLQTITQAHPYLVAQALKADWSILAYTSRGVVQNLDGSQGGNLPSIWQRINPQDSNSHWGFTPQPDVVVINLGTADINYWVENPNVTPNPTAMSAAYLALLKDVRAHYPNANIIAAVGPQLSQYQCLGGATLTGGVCMDASGQMQPSVLATIETVVKGAVQQAADAKVSFLEYPTNSTDVTCDYAPDAAGQNKLANQLVGAIEKVTGWK